MIVAEFRVVPMGSGSSMRDEMQKVVDALERSDVRFAVGPVATTIEARDLDALFGAIKRAHDTLAGDVPRIEMEISIDHRLDKEETMRSLRSGVPEEHAVSTKG